MLCLTFYSSYMTTIAGKTTWAQLCAKVTRPGGGISGLPVFVTGDTKTEDLFTFARGSQP
jgi:hypothetical protein